MKEKKQTILYGQSSKLDLSIDELKGRQSVRATFRLPKQAIDLLTVIAGQLGIKQKSLFDQLVEDISVLGEIANEARNYQFQQQDRRQKTFVISRNSLVALDSIAREQSIPRDLLVEFSIRRLLPVIESELKKHEKRKILLRELKEYLQWGKQIRHKAEYLLGRDDIFFQLIDQQVSLSEKNVESINSMIEKGKPMEDW